MTLFWLMLGLSLVIGGFAWYATGLDAVLLLLLHPVLWALVILAVAGITRIERDEKME